MKNLITALALLVASCASGPTMPSMQAALNHDKAALACDVTYSGFTAAAKACDNESCALRAQVGYEAAKVACAVTLKRLEAKTRAAMAAERDGGS